MTIDKPLFSNRVPNLGYNAPCAIFSKLDKSVNFIYRDGNEARYARDADGSVIAYLSSHGGCNKACRMCHLTQMGSTHFYESSGDGMLAQLCAVLGHYATNVQNGAEQKSDTIHLNWMARGEPLASSVILQHWPALSERLRLQCQRYGFLHVEFKISTIFPQENSAQLVLALKEVLASCNPPTIYYSLYSANEAFRRKWLPQAADPAMALMALRGYARTTYTPLALHWAYIEGENDSEQSMSEILMLLDALGIKDAHFNLLRYNPYSPQHGKEPPEAVLQARFEVMTAPGGPAVTGRIVQRVGFDVMASGGMFIPIASQQQLETQQYLANYPATPSNPSSSVAFVTSQASSQLLQAPFFEAFFPALRQAEPTEHMEEIDNKFYGGFNKECEERVSGAQGSLDAQGALISFAKVTLSNAAASALIALMEKQEKEPVTIVQRPTKSPQEYSDDIQEQLKAVILQKAVCLRLEVDAESSETQKIPFTILVGVDHLTHRFLTTLTEVSDGVNTFPVKVVVTTNIKFYETMLITLIPSDQEPQTHHPKNFGEMLYTEPVFTTHEDHVKLSMKFAHGLNAGLLAVVSVKMEDKKLSA